MGSSDPEVEKILSTTHTLTVQAQRLSRDICSTLEELEKFAREVEEHRNNMTNYKGQERRRD